MRFSDLIGNQNIKPIKGKGKKNIRDASKEEMPNLDKCCVKIKEELSNIVEREDQSQLQIDLQNIQIHNIKGLKASSILEFHRGGIIGGSQRKILNKLKNASKNNLVQYKVDFHGYTVPDALSCLLGAMSKMETQGLKVLEIIHGKGLHSGSEGAILKGFVNKWLISIPKVLAFQSKIDSFGESGVVVVLLR